jgi:cardiolipin synthase (CMP-forming)
MLENKDSTHKIVTVPNILTLLRFLLVGVMAAVFLNGNPIWAMIIYIFAAATDLVDGYIARKFNQISNVGKVMDPIADKLMTITALVCMLLHQYLTIGVLIVIIIKEALMVIGGILIYFVFKKVVYANLYGKIAAGAYFLAIMLLFLHDYVKPADAIFMYVAVALNVISIFQYGYINIIMEYKKRREEAKA